MNNTSRAEFIRFGFERGLIMSQMFSRITLALIIALQMTVWAGENLSINELASSGASVAFQENDNVPINQLPSPVTAAIKNRFPKSELLWAEKDWEDGNLRYEVKVRSKGQVYDVDVTPSGKILKIERDDS